MDMQDLPKLFGMLKESRIRYNELTDRIYEPTPREEWLEHMRQRTAAISADFEKNKTIIDDIYEAFHEEELPEEFYEELFFWTKDMYLKDYEDPFMLEKFLLILIPHYEERDDYEHLIFLYLCAGYSYIEMSRIGDAHCGRISVSYYKKILQYKDYFADFRLSENRTYLMTAYCNLVRVEPELGHISLEEAYELWQELKELRSNPIFCQFDEENPKIPLLADLTLNDFQKSALMFYRKMGHDAPELFKKLEKITWDFYFMDGKTNTEVFERQTDAYYRFVWVLYTEKLMSAEKAFQKMNERYQSDKPQIGSLSQEERDPIGQLLNPVDIMIAVLMETNFPNEEKERLVKGYCKDILDTIMHYPRGYHSYTLNTSILNIAINNSTISMLFSDDEKIEFVLQVVVARQLTTYIHSKMVSRIAELILDEILQKYPEYLVGIMGCKTASEVLEKQEEIRKYASYAALLHDIGKNAMIDIITTENRKLTDHEFEFLRMHPQLGADMLSVNPAFLPYRDIVVGHHKRYDGHGGYPENFDNVASPWKPIIDLITICDCADAATDYLGRNYQRAKSFGKILEELKKGAGTWYHPGYVALIEESPELFENLQNLTEKQRESIFYETYHKYFLSVEEKNV